MTTPDDIEPHLTDDLACVVVQYPNFFGGIEDIAAIGDLAHARGGALVVSTYPVPLGLLKPPGELGADVVAAEGQSLGVPQSYGGPYVGLLASRQSYVRQMPGRLAGMTTDTEGKRGFVLTLQTREQHIRREKATCNICTNQGLMATAATVYMATLGPEGFREVARRCYQNAHYLAERLSGVPGYAAGHGRRRSSTSSSWRRRVRRAKCWPVCSSRGSMADLDLGQDRSRHSIATCCCAPPRRTPSRGSTAWSRPCRASVRSLIPQ